jgi:DNA-binding HxlR family transcriptional regulator
MERSLDVLGRKWALLVLRDVAFLRLDRFGHILRNNPGLSPRILSRRLRELQAEGILERAGEGGQVRYQATAKGQDALYILFALLRYGLIHHGGEVTASPRPAPPPAAP